MVASRRHAWPARRDLALVTGIALLSLAAWAAVIPPFEAPDESWFYRQAAGLEDPRRYRRGLFHVLASPLVRRGAGDAPVDPTRNPAFRFISNRRGDVNMFVHAPPIAGARAHLPRLYLLRGGVVLLTAVATAAVFAMAHLVFGAAAPAFVVAAACLFIPQFSLMGAVVHPEALSRLLGALVVLVLVARGVGALKRLVSWLLLIPLLAMVPFADRQAFFLVPFAALGVMIVERRWRVRFAIAAALGAIAVVGIATLPRTSEAWQELAPWLQILRNPIAPFLAPDQARNVTPPPLAYYVFEFAPKMFFGFWGWLGQPSILLPPWLFGTLAVVTMLSATGLIIALARRAVAPRGAVRWHLVLLLATGLGMMLLPLAYAPAIAGRNLWYGRWLFPLVGPIMIGAAVGIAAFASAALRRPHVFAAGAAVVAAALWLLWSGETGAWVRHGIAGHHYGDQAHLLATIRASLIALAFVPLVIECVHLVSRTRRAEALRYRAGVAQGFSLAGASSVVIALVAANAAVLFGFVRPLYASLGPPEYVTAIRREVALGEYDRAAGLYRHARVTFPLDETVRALASEMPRLLIPDSADASALQQLEIEIARGARFTNNADLLALARAVRVYGWHDRPALAHAGDAAREPHLAEGAALLRLQFAPRGSSGAVEQFITTSGIVRRDTVMHNGQVDLVGFSVHRTPRGAAAVTVYYIPRVPWSNRRFWLHAYPPGVHDYVDVPPVAAPFDGWVPGEVAWDTFELPAADRFVVYVGVWVGGSIGPAYSLGTIEPPP